MFYIDSKVMRKIALGGLSVAAAIYFAVIMDDMASSLDVQVEIVYGAIAAFTVIVLWWMFNSDDKPRAGGTQP